MQIREYIPYYKRNLNVALPVMITQAGQVLVQLADNIMVGQLGAAQLAGISFANAVLVIGVVFAIGFSQGITPIVGQYFGRNEHNQVSKNLCNSIVLNLILMIFTTFVMFGVGAKLHLFGQDPEVLEYARGYYYILTASFIPMIVFNGIRFFSEGIGNTKYAMWITISTNILNIFLNWVLIYGKLGAEAMGVDGAALATLIARIVAAILFVALMFIAKEYRQYTLSIKFKDLNFKTIREQLRLSIPISIQSTLEVTSFSIAAIMV